MPGINRVVGESFCMGIGLFQQALQAHPNVVGINLGRRALEFVVREVMTNFWETPDWKVKFSSVAVTRSELVYTLSFIERVSGTHVEVELGNFMMARHEAGQRIHAPLRGLLDVLVPDDAPANPHQAV